MQISGQQQPKTGVFPPTQWSLISAARQSDEAACRGALTVLLQRYLPALRVHLLVRRGIPAHDVQDLLQGFVADKIIEERLLDHAQKAKGKFRSFLLATLEHYVISPHRGQNAAKRAPAGGVGELSEAAHQLPSAEPDPADSFNIAWARELIAEALRRMRAALPAGSYRIRLSPRITATRFNDAEPQTARHAVASIDSTGVGVIAGAEATIAKLVARPTRLGDLSKFVNGTPFLSQLHGDLGALLDQQRSASGDDAGITNTLLRQMLERLRASIGDVGSMLAIFLDPVEIDLQDPGGSRVTYDLNSGAFDNQIGNAFVSVSSNVELVVIPLAEGRYTLTVDDVPALARGGAVILGDVPTDLITLTSQLRDGERVFTFDIKADAPPQPSPVEIVRGGMIAAAATTIAGATLLLDIGSITKPAAPSSFAAAAAARGDIAIANIIADAQGGGETQVTPAAAPGVIPPELDAQLRELAGTLREYLSRWWPDSASSKVPRVRASDRDRATDDKGGAAAGVPAETPLPPPREQTAPPVTPPASPSPAPRLESQDLCTDHESTESGVTAEAAAPSLPFVIAAAAVSAGEIPRHIPCRWRQRLSRRWRWCRQGARS